MAEMPTKADLKDVFETLRTVARSIGFDVSQWEMISRNGAWLIQKRDDGRYVDTELPKHIAEVSDPETTYNRLADYIAAFTAVRNLRAGG
ncbi:hypothetical protein ACFP2T_43350 [Plantactinospora solaniradicis]|uniref:Uncharacterized protein n=1 Tax=Plantactinospora solaniradicis TaxID=1723736 RepID=A0ABW1KMZ1_9ACTN